MLEAPLYSAAGARAKQAFALPADYFDGKVHEPALHQAVTAFLANQRQGTAATKTRSYVSGGNQKPWRQKGTGRARQGTIRAPHWRGGGVVFGPHPRDYRTAIPVAVRRLARRSALNARAREGSMLVIDALSFEKPRTRDLAALLDKMGLEARKVLVLTHGNKPFVHLSGRNLPGTRVLPWNEATAYDVLWADILVVEQGALGGEMEVGATEESQGARVPGRQGAGAKGAKATRGTKATKAAKGAKAAKSAKGAKKAASARRKKEAE